LTIAIKYLEKRFQNHIETDKFKNDPEIPEAIPVLRDGMASVPRFPCGKEITRRNNPENDPFGVDLKISYSNYYSA
jgi:hypothetical protein